MKNCYFCEKSMKTQNFKKHQKVCFFKVEFNESKSNVLRALYNLPKENLSPVKSDQVDLALIELKNFLTEFFNKSRLLHKKIIEDDLRDPIERIKELHVNDSTKDGYIVEYKLFKKWLNKNKKTLTIESANSYLASLKCKGSTLKKKMNILQNLLRLLIDPHIKLNPIRMRISYQSKYSLSEEEVHLYLEEQKSNPEFYLIQKFMIIYGLRVNTVAGLKLKHLNFLHPGVVDIIIPDTKTSSDRIEKITEELSDEFNNFIAGKNLEQEDFIFYRESKNDSVRKRATGLCKLINKRIDESKALKKNANYKFSSHMFRKTKANTIYQEGLAQLRDKARKAIGHSGNSSSINHYIEK